MCVLGVGWRYLGAKHSGILFAEVIGSDRDLVEKLVYWVEEDEFFPAELGFGGEGKSCSAL